jgi:molybdopterin synthase catalytic subunit
VVVTDSDRPMTGPGPDAASRESAMHIRVRLFAVQRELAGTREVPLVLPQGATVEDAWDALVERVPALAPGRSSVRFAVNGDYADAATVLHERDELACIPPVSGGADVPKAAATDRRRILEIREEPFGTDALVELTNRLATPQDGAVVAFLGRTRVTPGTPAPGQEREALRHRGRAVERLEYEAHETMALRMLTRIADEIEDRFDVPRLAIVHRVGDVPLGEVSVAVVAVSPHRDAAFLAAKYAIDETKGRVPIWKAERFEDGHVWIGEQARTDAPTKAEVPARADAPTTTEAPAPAEARMSRR